MIEKNQNKYKGLFINDVQFYKREGYPSLCDTSIQQNKMWMIILRQTGKGTKNSFLKNIIYKRPHPYLFQGLNETKEGKFIKFTTVDHCGKVQN